MKRPPTSIRTAAATLMTAALGLCAQIAPGVVDVPMRQGKISLSALADALLKECGVDAHLPIPDRELDVSGFQGSLICAALETAVDDIAQFRRDAKSGTFSIEFDRMRLRAIRHGTQRSIARAIGSLTGTDILKRRYTLQLPDDLAADATCIVCIHGLDSSAATFGTLRSALAPSPSATFEFANDEAIDRIGRALSTALTEQSHRFPQRRFIIVAHSMGGLVSRYMLETPGLDPGNVDRLLMLGTPQHGSRLANLRPGNDIIAFVRGLGSRQDVLETLLDGLGEAGWDLWPESPFLEELNARKRNPDVRYDIVLGNRGLIDNTAFAALREGLNNQLEQTAAKRFAGGLDSWLGDLDELVTGRGDSAVSLERGKLAGVASTTVIPVLHNDLPAAVETIRALLEQN